MSGPDAMAIFFWVFATITCGGAMIVVFSRNIVRAATGLILSLFGVAVLFFLAEAEFLGAMQLMIYVGGTVVLLAFGVMLTARSLFLRIATSAEQWLLALLLACPLGIILVQAALSYSPTEDTSPAIAQLPVAHTATSIERITPARLGMALLGFGENDQRTEKGDSWRARSSYLLPFELISVHLLVVLIGAAHLARRESLHSKSGVRLDSRS